MLGDLATAMGDTDGAAPAVLLANILAALRVSAEIAQGAHWRAAGPNSYSDHQLYGEVYQGLYHALDPLAELAVHVAGVDAVDDALLGDLSSAWHDALGADNGNTAAHVCSMVERVAAAVDGAAGALAGAGGSA